MAADPRKVRQVLLKLTDNALKFTERGLVDIHLEIAENGQAVRFCVSDTGHGVAPDMAGNLFNPFSLGSYSYWKVGQYTLFSGAEGAPSGNCHFAGEHCSTSFQGYMEGGASEGIRAATEIITG